ncbi:hypothetical protein OC845_000410 [Tilletia horrida]|nr:hypothetical protein OC845_000410 [Tilletia horrida]
MPREGPPPNADPNATPSATYTSEIGSAVAPRRRRHREDQVEHAYELQRDAAIKGAAIWTMLGGSGVIMSHYLFPGFRRQTLAFKAFLVSGGMSIETLVVRPVSDCHNADIHVTNCNNRNLRRAPPEATIFGLVVGADTVLLNHESKERSEEHAIRNRARLELGRRGIVASESEIERWKEEVRRDYYARIAKEQEQATQQRRPEGVAQPQHGVGMGTEQ